VAIQYLEVPMMRRLTLGASIVLVLSSTSPTRSFNLVTDVAAQTPSSQASQPREQVPSNMQDMMKMHEQMMAEMKAADSRLDALVKEMNAATGDAKVNAVAAVVTELVRQQRSMHDRMGQMHQQMMGARGMMMKK
jgi:ABC-type glycerol-3-phosphate transport system substrate-binding protein